MKKGFQFILMISGSLIWLLISIFLSLNWLNQLARQYNLLIAILIITGIAYLPGFLCANLFITLLFVRYRPINEQCNEPITFLIPAYNEQAHIYETLASISNQKYQGNISIIVVDNGSTDNTSSEVLRAQKDFNLDIKLLFEPKKGKYHALNQGLQYVTTKYFISLDADTVLHSQATHHIVLAISKNPSIGAVAGGILVKNHQNTLLTRMQFFDYILSINAIKNLQSQYGSTLVAQGAFSIYETNLVKKLGGWDDSVGEDIVLTWKILANKRIVHFEPRAVSYTIVPESLKAFFFQRLRWARGMIEGLKAVKPWQQRSIYAQYLTFIDLLIPLIDLCYVLFFIPGIILSLFGQFILVGPFSLYVLPLLFISYFLMIQIEYKQVLEPLNLTIKFSLGNFLTFLFIYQGLVAYSAFIGYLMALLPSPKYWRNF